MKIEKILQRNKIKIHYLTYNHHTAKAPFQIYHLENKLKRTVSICKIDTQ